MPDLFPHALFAVLLVGICSYALLQCVAGPVLPLVQHELHTRSLGRFFPQTRERH